MATRVTGQKGPGVRDSGGRERGSMSESVLFGLEWSQLAPVLAAYLFGIATGWLVWGGRRPPVTTVSNEDAERQGDLKQGQAGNGASPTGAPSPSPDRLAAIEEEIRKARNLLEEGDEETKFIAEEIDTLDQAIKRANGRLKLILRAIERAALDR